MGSKIAWGVMTVCLTLWPLPTFAERGDECADAIADAINDYTEENGTPEENQEQGRAEVCERVQRLNPTVFAQLVRDQLCDNPGPVKSPDRT